MDTKTFFDNFGTIADAPGGIARLRSLILDLAVRGKLVEQIPTEKKPVFLPVDGLYVIPQNWVWCKLEDIADYGGRGNVLPNQIIPTDWILDLEDIEKTSGRLNFRVFASHRQTKSNKARFQVGDVLYGKLRPYLDKVLVADLQGYCTTEIVPIVPKLGIGSFWLRLSLKSPNFLAYVDEKSYGMKMPRLGTKDAKASIHAVPPLAEQMRIITKVNELMTLCDELEQKKKLRDDLRVAARASSIDAISTASTTDELNTAWKRIHENWITIADTPESIASLRSLILDLAIRGNLTNNQVTEFDSKSGLPRSWGVSKLVDVCVYIQRGKGPKYVARSNFPVVSQKCVRWSGFDITQARFIDPQSLASYSDDRFLRSGDILWNSTGTGTVGRTAIYVESSEFDQVVADSHVTVLRAPGMDPRFLWSWTASPGVQSRISDLTSGTTNQQELNLSSIKSLDVPVPLIAEQKRIVEKVDLLMALCDELEKSLKDREAIARKLAGSVVSDIAEVAA